MSASVGPPTSSSECGGSEDVRRTELERCLEEASALPAVDAESCAWLRGKLSEGLFNLVAAGQFKRGKSTLINALLGEALLPAGVVPLTSVVTIIRSGPVRAARVSYRDGRTARIETSQLADYVTEPGNPRNEKAIERVEIELSSPWLANGVRLIDTPGIASVYEHNTDETQRYLPQADAVLFIASVDQPVSRAELDFLRDIRRHAGKVFCLLNKTDYLRPEELRESLAFCTEAIRSALGSAEVPVFAISARLALAGKLGGDPQSLARSGFPELERALERFMSQERTAAWLTSIGRGAQRLLAQAGFTLALESKALAEPLDRIESHLALFREEKAKAQQARADYRVLIEADARVLLKEGIERRLDAFKRAEQRQIGAEIDRWVQELRHLPPRRLRSALDERTAAAIRSAYDAWLAQEDTELTRAFQQLCARFWRSLQQSVDDLIHRTSELFAIAAEQTPVDPRWVLESGFYYKFWYEPTSLNILATSLTTALPRFLAASLIARRARRNATEVIEVQAGRIRHDLEERLKKSVRDAERQILGLIEATVTGIEAALENALATRRSSAARAAARSAEIEDSRRKVSELAERLKGVLRTDVACR